MEDGFGAGLVGLLYPRRCPVCHEAVSPAGRWICRDCEGVFFYIKGPVCLKCGKELRDDTKELCYDCENREKVFEASTALMNYDKTAKESMVHFKYKGRREYADFYAEALYMYRGELIRRWNPQLIVPVPVHKSRLRIRGYNQAEEIAKRLGKRMNIPVRNDILVRSRKTDAQKELGAAGREHNLEKALDVTLSLEGVKRILVVDDIYTTGSTLQACAKALKKAGAEKVYGCTICIGSDS